MKFEILFANILFAASTAFAVPMDLDSFPEITNVSDDADTTAHPPTPDSPPSTPPVVIPVVGTIDELPNIGVLERSPVFNQEEITRLNDKILSVPLVVGQEEQLYLVVHEAKTFQYHNEQAGKRQRLENHGVLFTFSLSMIDTIRVEQQFWDDVLYALSDDQPGVSTVIDEANSPNTLRQPLKSCFTAAWRPGGVIDLMMWSPEKCAPVFDAHTINAYLDKITRRLGAGEIIHVDLQTTQLNFKPAGGDCQSEEECAVTIRTPLWNLIMNGRGYPEPIRNRLTSFGFEIDTKTYPPFTPPTFEAYYVAKDIILNIGAADLSRYLSKKPAKMGANVIRGILEKHSIYLEAHSILDLIRELYSNREVSIQDGEDARLLLKILFGVPWSRIEHAYETGQAIPSCFNYKVPFFKAIMLYQSYTPLTRTL